MFEKGDWDKIETFAKMHNFNAERTKSFQEIIKYLWSASNDDEEANEMFSEDLMFLRFTMDDYYLAGKFESYLQDLKNDSLN